MQVSLTPSAGRNSLFVLSVLSFLTLWIVGGLESAHGSAQSADPEPDQTSVEAHRSTTESSTGLDDLFQFLDRDGNGRVDRYEGAEAFLFLTAEADADGDKALSQKELVHFLERESAEEQAEKREVFQDLDENGDGVLTSEELPGGLSGVLPEADLDKDGLLTFEELTEFDGLDDPGFEFEQELRGFLEEVDKDGDGSFALADLPPPARTEFEEEFNELDIDKDGLVSEAELLVLLEEELRGAEFEVHGTDALMSGVIGPNTPGRVLELVVEHPEVRRIVMLDMPGSMDDDSNLRAARLVRQRGFATHVPSDGEVASGATDLFQAGTVRTKGDGARFGVHSWSGFGVDGADVPKDDPQHEMYLEYCREMGIPESFYWYTLEAAPADDIHWMTEGELQRFDMLTDADGEVGSAEDQPTEVEKVGGCVLVQPIGTVPDQLRRVTDVSPTEEFGPLTKSIQACGITLAAEDAVDDEFLTKVGVVIAEIFLPADDMDARRQAAVLTHLYRYKALLPVPLDEDSLERLIQANEEAFVRVEQENSLCDIIMSEAPEGQVMEVVEHILHTVTDVGLHYEFPAEWGLSRESELWKTMQLAIERGHYAIESYEDMKRHADAEVYERVLMQEFAYWFITTAWDLQEPYGPDESEWTLRTRGELQRAYPEFYAIYERTAGRVLHAPSREALAKIGPRRSEER